MTRRYIFSAVSLLSLLLGIATLALWERSYSACDMLRRIDRSDGNGHYLTFWSWHGSMYFWRTNVSRQPPWPRAAAVWVSTHNPLAGFDTSMAGEQWKHGFAGFTLAGHHRMSALPAKGAVYDDRFVGAVIPDWFLMAMFALAPTWCAFMWRRTLTRRPPGHCRRCNYDLTGNTSGICPECGTALPSKSGQR